MKLQCPVNVISQSGMKLYNGRAHTDISKVGIRDKVVTHISVHTSAVVHTRVVVHIGALVHTSAVEHPRAEMKKKTNLG